MNKGFFREVLMPVTVIVYLVIFMVVAIGLTNNLLEKKFAINEIKAMERLPKEVLPDGDTFERYDKDPIVGVTSCYVAKNRKGIVTISNLVVKGGELKVMVGVNNKGKVTGVKILDQEYVKGPYEELASQGYLKAYIGKSALTAENISEDIEMDVVHGAEEASDAVYQGVRVALSQAQAIYGEQ